MTRCPLREGRLNARDRVSRKLKRNPAVHDFGPGAVLASASSPGAVDGNPALRYSAPIRVRKGDPMPRSKNKTLGVLTGGGDCPGLNAVVRAVVKTAVVENGWDAIGIHDGYLGLIENRSMLLRRGDVS